MDMSVGTQQLFVGVWGVDNYATYSKLARNMNPEVRVNYCQEL